MKEIKFRAWDKELGFFQEDENIFINQNGAIVEDDTGEWTKDKYEIQFYTGLKDKNGKEIYEGDIVSVWRDGSNRKFAIKWRETGVPMYILYPQPMNENFWHCRSDMQMAWEVIGNIYENKELLEAAP